MTETDRNADRALAHLVRKGEAGVNPIEDAPLLGLAPQEAALACLVLIGRGWARICSDWRCRPTGEGKMMWAAGVGCASRE